MGNNHNKKEIKKNNEIKTNENIIKEQYKYNILLIGESDIGTKTSLIKRVIEGKFIDINYKEREKCENLIYETDNKKIILYLIDTNGKKDKRELAKKYFKNADCIIMGYDVTNKESFQQIIDYWYKEIKELSNTKLIYLLGNKINLKKKIIIKDKEGKSFADKNNIKFYSISVKGNINIQNFFNDLKSCLANNTINNNINNNIKDIIYGNPSKESYKVILLGDCGVGNKSSLVNRIQGNDFEPNMPSTSGAYYITKSVSSSNGKNIRIEIWDTPGQEKYKSLYHFYFKDLDCIVLGYDITRKATFENIENYWYPIIENLGVDLIYLLANKIDLFEESEVSEKDARKYAKEKNFRYFEISCLTYVGINEFLQDLANELIKR